MSQDLKPCPFCGTAPKMLRDFHAAEGFRYWIVCADPDCTADHKQPQDEAIAAWNRRAEGAPAAAGASTEGGIAHGEAKAAALRLIAGAFRRDGERLESRQLPRFSIPCRPDHDDDCMILAYIDQQQARPRLSPPAAEGKEDAVTQLVAMANEARALAADLHSKPAAAHLADPLNRMAYAMGAKCDHFLEAAEVVRKAAALCHAPAPAAEPVGDWVMVPREPTEAMIDAAKVSFADDGPIAFANFYCAMVAASPPPEPVAISREEIARIIDPNALWGLNPDVKIGFGTRDRQRDALIKADAILSKLSGRAS